MKPFLEEDSFRREVSVLILIFVDDVGDPTFDGGIVGKRVLCEDFLEELVPCSGPGNVGTGVRARSRRLPTFEVIFIGSYVAILSRWDTTGTGCRSLRPRAGNGLLLGFDHPIGILDKFQSLWTNARREKTYTLALGHSTMVQKSPVSDTDSPFAIFSVSNAANSCFPRSSPRVSKAKSSSSSSECLPESEGVGLGLELAPRPWSIGDEARRLELRAASPSIIPSPLNSRRESSSLRFLAVRASAMG